MTKAMRREALLARILLLPSSDEMPFKSCIFQRKWREEVQAEWLQLRADILRELQK